MHASSDMCTFKKKVRNCQWPSPQVSASKTMVTWAINYMKRKTQGLFVEQGQVCVCVFACACVCVYMCLSVCVWTKGTSNHKVRVKGEGWRKLVRRQQMLHVMGWPYTELVR